MNSIIDIVEIVDEMVLDLYDEEDDWKYLCPKMHWGGQYGCDLCNGCKDKDNQEMEKEWLNEKKQYSYLLHKKWIQERQTKPIRRRMFNDHLLIMMTRINLL